MPTRKKATIKEESISADTAGVDPIKSTEHSEELERKHAEMLKRRREKRLEKRLENEWLANAKRIEEKIDAEYREIFYSLSFDSYFGLVLINIVFLIPGFVLAFLGYAEDAVKWVIFYVLIWSIIFLVTLKPTISNEEKTRPSDSIIMFTTIFIVLLGLFNPKTGQYLLLFWFIIGIAFMLSSISSSKSYGTKYGDALKLITFVMWTSGSGALYQYVMPFLTEADRFRDTGRFDQLSPDFEHNYSTSNSAVRQSRDSTSTTGKVWTNKEIAEISRFIEKEKKKRHDKAPFGSD